MFSILFNIFVLLLIACTPYIAYEAHKRLHINIGKLLNFVCKLLKSS